MRNRRTKMDVFFDEVQAREYDPHGPISDEDTLMKMCRKAVGVDETRARRLYRILRQLGIRYITDFGLCPWQKEDWAEIEGISEDMADTICKMQEDATIAMYHLAKLGA